MVERILGKNEVPGPIPGRGSKFLLANSNEFVRTRSWGRSRAAVRGKVLIRDQVLIPTRGSKFLLAILSSRIKSI